MYDRQKGDHKKDGIQYHDLSIEIRWFPFKCCTRRKQMILTAAQYLDDETILKHLPFLTSEEVDEIQKRKAEEDLDRMGGNEPPEDLNNET